MTTITAVATVAIPARDQERSKAFYVERLGFEDRADVEMSVGFRWIEVAPPGSDVDELFDWPDAPLMFSFRDMDGNTLYLVETQIQLFGDADNAGHSAMTIVTPDMAAARSHLSSNGLELGEDITGDFGIIAHISDPDGNQLILTEPPRDMP